MTEGTVATPPNSAESEKSILTILCRNPALACVAVRLLTPERFYTPVNREMFKLIGDMERAGQMIDHVSTTERAIKQKLIDKIGGPERIAELFFPAQEPAPEHLSFYADVVNEKATRRDVIASASEAAKLASSGESVNDAVRIMEESVEKARQPSSGLNSKSIEDMGTILPRVVDQLAERYDVFASGGVPGIRTGFQSLDKLTGGWRRKSLYIIGARPSVGKTAIMMDFIHALVNHDTPEPVLFFSLEMAAEEVTERLLCKMSRVSYHGINSRCPSKSELSRLMAAADTLRRRPLHVDDSPEITITEIKQKVRDAVREHKVSVVGMDYLQLGKGSKVYGAGEKRLEIGEISLGLKGIAKTCDVAVIALAQINREATGREPRMSDLKESGSLEQDADFVGLLNRPNKDEDSELDTERVQFIVDKQRNGPVGMIEMGFHKPTMSFVDRGDTRYEQ